MLVAVLVVLCLQFFFDVFLLLAIFSGISNGNAASQQSRLAIMEIEKTKVELLSKMVTDMEWERILKNDK